MDETLRKQIDAWAETDEHGRIVDMLGQISPEERDSEATGLLARAYNNLIERKKVPFILELCRHLRHDVGIKIEQMCIALYGECEFIVSTQVKMHILIYQIRTNGNKLNSITAIKLSAVLNNPGKFLFVIGKPLPEVLHPLPERQSFFIFTQVVICTCQQTCSFRISFFRRM